MIRKFITAVSLSFFILIISIIPAKAADSGMGIGCGEGLGPVAEALCNIQSTDTELAGGEFNRIIGVFLGFMTITASIWFMFQMITAGYGWLSAGGDKTKTEAAWHKITNSLIGLVIVVSAWILTGLIGSIVGLDILNPGKMFNMLIQ
ncbi:hypothetical protein HY338_03470 [Candidatus Gottesmanbacteria bacterium]|nr:hypothetical protein [Candidatus Gottesmanbacteria bacterium]